MSDTPTSALPTESKVPTTERKQEIAGQLATIHDRMNQVLGTKGSNPQDARLVAVSKLKPVSDLVAAYEAGQRHFGENYVQELESKSTQLPNDVQWHFIGSLQSNKCKVVAAIPNLYVVETVDSAKKASTLNKACEGASTPVRTPTSNRLKIFLQVNTSGEDTKSGMTAEEVVEVAQHVVNACPLLELAGLMTIGSPRAALENGDNPDFKLLNECKEKILASSVDLARLKLELSMGMSDDFEQALKQGSTNVRVGSTIFGSRPPKSAA